MLIKRNGILIFFLLTLSCLFPQSSEVDVVGILSPRAHNPVFVEPGGKFIIELRDVVDSLPKTEWSAVLKNDLSEWRADVKSIIQDKIHNGIEDGYRIEVVIPNCTPPELMELIIYHPSGLQFNSERAVSVVSDFEEDFYIIHQSDEHVTVDNAVEPGGKSSLKWGNGSKEAIKWLTPILNIINPRFVLHTGDNTQIYHESDQWVGLEEAKSRTERFLNGVSDYQVPTIIIPGNHDLGWSSYIQNKEWRKIYFEKFGKTTFSFTMGSFYFLTNEWTNNEFIEWAKRDFESSYDNPLIEYRLLASHFYDGLNSETTIGDSEKLANLLLVGHNHRTRILQEEPFYVLSVGSAQIYQQAAFYDFRRTSEGWTSEQHISHAVGVNVHKLIGDYGLPTVFSEYSSNNDGTTASNTVKITNKLPHKFYNGRIRFLMKKGNYRVEGGEVLSSYDYDDAEKTAVVVKVNIKENSNTWVSIKSYK